MTPLAKYVYAALIHWLAIQATTLSSAGYESVSSDIAEVTSDLSEPVVFNDKAEDALVLAFIGGKAEGGMAPWVDNGRCNDLAWRRSREGLQILAAGDCDGGHAYSLWQIHVGGGIALTSLGGWSSWQYAETGATIYRARDLLNRKTAIRIAYHIIRQSIKHTKTLIEYTGETQARHPKADFRLMTPRAYYLQQPYSADPVVLPGDP